MTVSSPAGYAIAVKAAGDFGTVVARARTELQKEGFGVISEIDMAGTLKAKIGVEIPPQLILGACNPKLAHQALEAEPEIGLLLPCNVVVRQDDGQVVVSAMDPVSALALTNNPKVDSVAELVREKLVRVLEGIAAGGES